MRREVLCRSARRRWSRQGRALDLGPSETTTVVASCSLASRSSRCISAVAVPIYHCRDRSTVHVCIPLQANAPRPFVRVSFSPLRSQPASQRASERANDFLARPPRLVSSSLPLILSPSPTSSSSVAPSIAAELAGERSAGP